MKKDGLYEKVKKGLKRNPPKYDDELEELEKENLLCGSKENTQRNKLTMKEKNTLQYLGMGCPGRRHHCLLSFHKPGHTPRQSSISLDYSVPSGPFRMFSSILSEVGEGLHSLGVPI